MKKIIFSILAIVLLFGVGITTSDFISFAEDESQEQVINVYNTDDFISIFSNEMYESENLIIKLKEDLDFSGIDLSDIYKSNKVFKGQFDGNGHIISNLTLTSQNNYYGLIPRANGAVIKDLKVCGNINFQLQENNQQKYIGVLVGQGENVKIYNCEFDNVSLDGQNVDNINLNITSNIVFGGIIGSVKSSISSSTQQSIISDCVFYYDLNFNFKYDTLAYLGGLVGELQAGSKIKNCLNFGDITINEENSLVSVYNSQFVGGIIGEAVSANCVNNCFAGIITININVLSNLSFGAIIGDLSNTNSYLSSCYWTQSDLAGIGQGENVNDNFKLINAINSEFLTNYNNFDIIELSFDFDTIWCLRNSKICLQRFQSFNYSINKILDNAGILKSAIIKTSEDDEGQLNSTVNYGAPLIIRIEYNDQYIGYYTLGTIYLQGESLNKSYYSYQPILDEKNNVKGYDIYLTVNDVTDGTYSFSLVASSYKCLVKISDEAKLNSQGGVSAGSNYIESLNIDFTYQTRTQVISAQGNGIYTFSYWELYYKAEDDAEGEYTILNEDFEDANSSSLSISFGVSPYNREFMLIAYFSSENAILVDFTNYQNEGIKSISLNDKVYEGQSIAVSNTDTTVRIKLITNSYYLLNVELFLQSVADLYGQNIEDLGIVQTSDPITDELTHETTYNFRLNMNAIKNIEDNLLSISFVVEKDNTQYNQKMLFVYIFVPIGVAIVLGVGIYLIIKFTRGGKKSSARKEKKKEDNYKDFYI